MSIQTHSTPIDWTTWMLQVIHERILLEDVTDRMMFRYDGACPVSVYNHFPKTVEEEE